MSQATVGAMDIEELLSDVLEHVRRRSDVSSASRVDGENAIGLEDVDGDEVFITIHPA